MSVKTSPFDPERYFADPAAQQELLHDAFATGDARYIANALGVIARANGVTDATEASSVARTILSNAFAENGDPKLSSLLVVLKAVGYELTVRRTA